MKKIINFSKKFAISIVVMICVAFLAFIYTWGGMLEVWFPTGTTLIPPQN